MPSVPTEALWGQAVPDLMSQATSLLTREMARLSPSGSGPSAQLLPGVQPVVPARAAELTAPASSVCPVTGATTPTSPQGVNTVREQAMELLSTLFAKLGAQGGELSGPLARHKAPTDPLDALRRQAHEFIETLLVTFNDATGEKGLPAEDQVPLLTSVAAVQAGEVARASLRVVNDEPTSSEVTLYTTNFVADAGYEIPAWHVHPSPRNATIAAKSEMTFQIEIRIPQQTPAGWYSGLIQASGCKYVKAVLSMEVL